MYSCNNLAIYISGIVDAEFEFAYQVRLDWLPLPCIALIQPSQLSCLGSSVGTASAS